MKVFIKTYWKTLLFFVLVGLVGGYLTGIYLLDSYPAEIRQQMLEELAQSNLGNLPISVFLGLVTALQAAGYGLVLGALGILLGKKTGLWKDERRLEKKPLLFTGMTAVIGGLALILPDMLFFGPRCQAIMDSYAVKPTLVYILASILYGGIIEEVMLRLFFLSLVAFLLHKSFQRKKAAPSVGIWIIANIIVAILFAAGHLPATFMLLGNSPIILLRCFVLNGGLGLVFGYLYRKYGLRYAMLAHGGCHIVSKLIWILFI